MFFYPVDVYDEGQGRGALSAITAAVVGVVLNLAVFFAVHVLFPSNRGVGLSNLDVVALAIALIAFIGMQRWKWDILHVVLGGVGAELVYYTLLRGT